MLQTINFSNEFDLKAIHDYIKRIPKIKKLKNQSLKIDEDKNKLSITDMPYLDAPYKISLKIVK